MLSTLLRQEHGKVPKNLQKVVQLWHYYAFQINTRSPVVQTNKNGRLPNSACGSNKNSARLQDEKACCKHTLFVEKHAKHFNSRSLPCTVDLVDLELKFSWLHAWFSIVLWYK